MEYDDGLNCCARVDGPGAGSRGPHQCSRLGIVERDGKRYCRQHSRTPRLHLWVLRHKVHGHLSGNGDLGEHSGVFSRWALAERERTVFGDDYEVVELAEVAKKE